MSSSSEQELQLLDPPVEGLEECRYITGDGLLELEQRLRALGVVHHWQVESVDGPSDYWVYLPALPGSSATQRLLKELQSKNIESYLIAEGEIKGGISLGVFVREDAAIAVQNRLRQAGYEARIQKQVHEKNMQKVIVVPEWKSPWIGPDEWVKLFDGFSGGASEKKSCIGLF